MDYIAFVLCNIFIMDTISDRAWSMIAWKELGPLARWVQGKCIKHMWFDNSIRLIHITRVSNARKVQRIISLNAIFPDLLNLLNWPLAVIPWYLFNLICKIKVLRSKTNISVLNDSPASKSPGHKCVYLGRRLRNFLIPWIVISMAD